MKKYNLTNEQKTTLYMYEEMFTKACISDYVSGVTKQDFDLVKKIYVEITKSQESLNYGCSYCVLKLFKNMGEIYYESKQRNEGEEHTASGSM